MTQMIDVSRSFLRFVESVRCVAPIHGESHRVDRLPDGRTSLVFRVLEGERADVTVVGPRTRALLKEATFVQALTIQLKPGWSRLVFGVAASELTNQYVMLEDLWGKPGGDLSLGLLDAKSVSEKILRVARVFGSRRPAFEPASASLARRAARMLEAEDLRVESVAGRLGVTARHLRRAFAENIGIGPKEFARSARLQRAVRMAVTSSDWVQIAMNAGYYDQAHLIADFRDLVGLSPTAFVKRASDLGLPASAALPLA